MARMKRARSPRAGAPATRPQRWSRRTSSMSVTSSSSVRRPPLSRRAWTTARMRLARRASSPGSSKWTGVRVSSGGGELGGAPARGRVGERGWGSSGDPRRGRRAGGARSRSWTARPEGGGAGVVVDADAALSAQLGSAPGTRRRGSACRPCPPPPGCRRGPGAGAGRACTPGGARSRRRRRTRPRGPRPARPRPGSARSRTRWRRSARAGGAGPRTPPPGRAGSRADLDDVDMLAGSDGGQGLGAVDPVGAVRRPEPRPWDHRRTAGQHPGLEVVGVAEPRGGGTAGAAGAAHEHGVEAEDRPGLAVPDPRRCPGRANWPPSSPPRPRPRTRLSQRTAGRPQDRPAVCVRSAAGPLSGARLAGGGHGLKHLLHALGWIATVATRCQDARQLPPGPRPGPCGRSPGVCAPPRWCAAEPPGRRASPAADQPDGAGHRTTEAVAKFAGRHRCSRHRPACERLPLCLPLVACRRRTCPLPPSVLRPARSTSTVWAGLLHSTGPAVQWTNCPAAPTSPNAAANALVACCYPCRGGRKAPF